MNYGSNSTSYLSRERVLVLCQILVAVEELSQSPFFRLGPILVLRLLIRSPSIFQSFPGSLPCVYMGFLFMYLL